MILYRFDIQTLQRWLNYELSGTVLFLVSFLFIASLYVLAGLVIIFLPLLIGTLIKEKRFGWLLSLFVFIIIPVILIFKFFYSTTWFFILQFVPAALFLLYCYLLRLTIPGWGDPVPERTPNLRL